ncbi:MAG: DUF3667 domain-containing protein [Porphyrobacter sp.]|nr:DUF3667 domain-containing protein [Porphyrobacter sp.]
MNGVGEGIGAAIEGGLMSRAVEPAHGEARGPAPHPGPCANCGAGLTGHYCSECGQSAHVHRSLAAIGHDIMHGVLHLDGKLFHTLPLLVFKPGQLTRRYVNGERAKFVSPMAMFLFSVFAMFAVFQAVGLSAPTDFGQGFVDGVRGDNPFRNNILEQIATLEQERDRLAKGDPRRAEIDDELTGLNIVLSKNLDRAGGQHRLKVNTGSDWVDHKLVDKWQKNPGLMVYKLQSNSYKFSWLLIPLSVPLLWLLFAWRRRFKAYDHAVFVTYSLSFMSLLFIVASILGTIPQAEGAVAGLLLIGAPLHLYKQLRHAYGLSRLSALWRFLVLLLAIPAVLTAFLLIVGALGAF